MRVLIAHASYRVKGGEDRYVEQQAALLRSRHEVELVTPSNEELGTNVGTAVTMTYSPALTEAFRSQVERFRPDVIHLHNPYPSLGPAVHLVASRHDVPLVQTVHNFRLRCPNGLMFTEGQACRRCEHGNYLNSVVHRCFESRTQASAYATVLWIHRFLLQLENKVDAFIAPSAFVRDQLLGWSIGEHRIATVRNFITPLPEIGSGTGTYGVYVGRVSKEKGIDVLVDALAIAGDPPFKIIGDGPAVDRVGAHIRRAGLRQTSMTGRLEPADVLRAVRDARFLVMPSIWDENAPLAVVEAMACGRPVVVSAKGGLPELVEDGGGLICEPADPRSLADAMLRLFSDDPMARRLGQQARSFAEEHLSAARHLQGLEAAYRRVRS